MTHFKTDHFAKSDGRSTHVALRLVGAAAHELVAIGDHLGGVGPGLPSNADALSSEAFFDFYSAWLYSFYPLFRPNHDDPARLREEFRLLVHCLTGTATLGQAIELQCHYIGRLWSDLCQVDLHDRGDTLDLVCRMTHAPGAGTCVYDLMMISSALFEFEWLVGGSLEGVSGRVQSPTLIASATARLQFPAPLTYCATETALSIPKRHLGRSIVCDAGGIDAFIKGLPMPALVEQDAGKNLTSKVASMLRNSLRHSSASITLTQIAASLSMNEVTLRRRLRQSGGSFRTIREDVIDELAKHWLTTPHLTVDAVAERLGYSDANAFRRSFQRRNSRSPSDFRHERAA